MFSQKELIQLEYAIKYVLNDLDHNIDTDEDAKWHQELSRLLAEIQERQHG